MNSNVMLGLAAKFRSGRCRCVIKLFNEYTIHMTLPNPPDNLKLPMRRPTQLAEYLQSLHPLQPMRNGDGIALVTNCTNLHTDIGLYTPMLSTFLAQFRTIQRRSWFSGGYNSPYQSQLAPGPTGRLRTTVAYGRLMDGEKEERTPESLFLA